MIIFLRLLSRSAKLLIALKAKEMFVRQGGVYTLEGGTTVVELAHCLAGYPATVMTNSIPVVNELRNHGTHPTVHCSGGLLREETGTLVGRQAITFFSRRKADTLFMTATGFDLHSGLTDPDPMEIEVKQAMACAARQVVLLLDSSKLGARSRMQVLPLGKVNAVITDKPMPPEYQTLLENSGVAVILAQG